MRLLAIAIAAVPNPAGHSCQVTHTLAEFKHAARSTYRGTRTPARGSYQRLWRLARCQRPPSTERRALRAWKVQHDKWAARRHPPLPYGRWAIPGRIVMCESSGQNLPPNSAGASGYYQIIPSTWRSYGGAGSGAYLASKAEQDRIAARIWAGGAGASQWVCA